MTSVLHLARKDLRHSRWLIAATWLVAAGILWLPATPVELRQDVVERLAWFRYGSWLLFFLTVGRVVQLDAPLRDTTFLRSRPVSPGGWLASKLLASLLILLPMALLEAAMIPLAGLRSEFIDLLAIFAEDALTLGAIAAVALALAARMETYSRFITITMGIAFAGFIAFVAYIAVERWLTRETKPEWSYDSEYLKLSRLLITQIITVLGLLAGLIICLRSRHPERLGSAIAGTTLAAALAWFCWPLNFVKTLTRPEAEAPRSEWPDLSQIGFAFERDRFANDDQSRFTWGFNGYNDVRYQNVRAFTRMNGLADEWFAYPNFYCSSLRSPEGHVAHSHHAAWGGLAKEVILPSVGISLPWKRADRVAQIEVGDFSATDVAAAGTSAVLEGQVGIPIKRPVVLARIPLKEGASAMVGNRRILIAHVELRQKFGVLYQVIEELPMSKLRGGAYGESHRHISMIVINAARREFLKQQSEGSSNFSTAHHAVWRMEAEAYVNSFQNRDNRTIPPGWLDSAELIITGDEYGGTFTREFRFENVNLTDNSWKR